MTFRSMAESVGATPLVELRCLSAGLPALVVAKLEARNPGGTRLELEGRRVVTVLADGGERYVTSVLLNELAGLGPPT